VKIAITSTGAGLNSAVDPRFGRCAYFALIDPPGGALEAVPNPFQQGSGGAGTQAAQWIARQGVEALLTGQCGPQASAVLRQAGIPVIEGVSGTVREATERYAREGASGIRPPLGDSRGGGDYGGGRGSGRGRGPGRGFGRRG